MSAPDAPQAWRVVCEDGTAHAPDDPHAPQPSPDLAAIAQRHAAAARVERTTLPAEVLAALADVPVLLRALAPQPAPDAPDVAAIGAMASRSTRGPWRPVASSVVVAGGDDHEWEVSVNTASQEQRWADAAFIAHARTDVPALLAWIAAEPARVAAAVAAETQRCIAACEHVASQCTELDDRDLAMTCAEAIAVDAPAQGGG